ncbi:hypothetical protein N431DRAFT_471098 [Stipitochalara longipes BDJ]|nr:hypothetical protein N431DRAFT_471098 [Stipitochalara longipes BDJ]
MDDREHKESRHFVTTSANLHQQTKAVDGLPSWASTWKVRDPEHFVPRFSSANLRFYASSKILTSRNSTVPFTSAKFSFSGNILFVEGKLIATLDDRFQLSDVEPEYFRDMLTFLPPGYISGESQSLWDSMLEFSFRANAPTETFIGVRKIWQVPMDYHAARKRTPARLQKVKLVVSMNRQQLRGPSKMSGIVPKETKSGDVLCWIRGIESLFVLRPTGPYFRVVGECFLDGYMRGWKSMGDTRIFQLC